MGSGSLLLDASTVTIHPRLGTGWEIVIDNAYQQILIQLKVLWVRLPLKGQIPYSEVVRVETIGRQAWWTGAMDSWTNPVSIGLPGSPSTRTEMPTRGWRYDILVSLKSGDTIRIATVKDPDTANEIERKSKERFRLQENLQVRNRM